MMHPFGCNLNHLRGHGGCGSVADVTNAAIAASSLAEVSWTEAGLPEARGVVALLHGDRPTLAFTYADAAVARSVTASPRVALTLTEPRSTGTTFRPLLVLGRPRLLEDPNGDLFAADLVVQELRRYPPSRALADSPLLQREHWWYLPRLLVEVDVDAVQPLAARVDALRDHLLVVAGEEGPSVAVAGLDHGGEGDLVGSAVPLATTVSPPPGPAVLFGQDASFPDLEQWSQWRYRGRWDGTHLHVEDGPASIGLGRVPGVVQRWRRQRDLERRCVAAIPRP
jgi:hypothetical protein